MRNTKILPFLYDDDDYDDQTIRYWEQHDEAGYFYELYVVIRSRHNKEIDRKRANIVITNEGVSLDIDTDPRTIMHTNIVPQDLFPGKKRLEWDDMYAMVKILENTDLEGVSHNAKELYQKWVDLGKPQA